MSEIKWIKIASYIFEDEKIRLIDAMSEGVMVIYVWIRLLVQAGKINGGGYIYLNENIPYTEEMLATLFCKPLESIKFALKTLCEFQMIEINSNNIIKILNWEKHQNIEGMERVRAQNRSRAKNYREKEKQIEKVNKDNNDEKLKDSNTNEVKQDNSFENYETNVNGNKNLDTNTKKSGENNSIEYSEENTCVDKNSKCDDINNSCNVTKNKSNVTVKSQNKSESKKEIKIKNENESENRSDAVNKKDLNYKECEITNELKAKNSRESPAATDKKSIDIKAMELLKHYEKITGRFGGLNFGAVKLAIDIHGENQVKLAILRALEVNKPDMTYINGILKNWRREGYPNQREEIKNGVRSTYKSNAANTNQFTEFKPKKPRNLTESERKRAEEKLI